MRPVLAHILVMFVFVASLGAAQRPSDNSGISKAAKRAVPKKKRSKSPRPYQVGKASWYGKQFHGRQTASGEPYDMFQFTAAHNKLPLGTLVKVTNLHNHRWVVVRVNDRGPVPASRIIDVSYGAAQILGIRPKGVESVRLDLVNPPTLASAQPAAGGMD
ncbi:MAG: septal ring lytic transglycosylase RlpA family protein [Terriglobales bacterium]